MREDVLARVMRMVEERLHDPLHVEDLAREACLSPFHFARMFKRSTGHTPHAFIIARRMERACRLLAGPTLSIAEVSRLAGFRTQAHFSGVFRAEVGETPGQYRRRHRARAERDAEGLAEVRA